MGKIRVLLLSCLLAIKQLLRRATDNRPISCPGVDSSHCCPHGEEAQGVGDPPTYRQAPLILTHLYRQPKLNLQG